MANPEDLAASNLLTLLARLDGALPLSINTMWLSAHPCEPKESTVRGLGGWVVV